MSGAQENPIGNVMLVANAGSGKTYELTTRMVRLLALGVDPRKIAALTFTKKAAGEFLDEVFLRLAEAAIDSEKLKKLSEDIKQSITREECLKLLEKLSSHCGSLNMGTIDSLFARIARSFPLESGLSGDFSMLGESDLDTARTESLATIFREGLQKGGDEEEFIDLIRRISRKEGEREIFGTLLRSVESFHETYLRTPENISWGDKKRIWPGGFPLEKVKDTKAAADLFEQEVRKEHPDLGKAASKALASKVAEIKDHIPGTEWSGSLDRFIKEKLCAEPEADANGSPCFGLGAAGAANKVHMRGGVPAARKELRDALLKPVFEKLLRRSAALHRFIARFEECYGARTRRAGRLTFSDITDLLARHVDKIDWRASVGYRLDSRFDHWLLDEFQDTSRSQWKILHSLIDEAVQDESGRRSLFYVGDTKQAIYSWRGGDPRLFFDIEREYNAGGSKVIGRERLDISRRSTKPLVVFINDVFKNPESVAHELEYSETLLKEWNEAWTDHRVWDENEKKKGYVYWERVESSDDAEDSSSQDLKILAILQKVEPWRRGWSCAVLKTKNEDAASLSSLLQSEGIPVAVEGKANPCTDNALGVALLAAFRLVASPKDKFSRTLVESSPLRDLLKNGEKSEEEFRAKALSMIAGEGYEELVREWTKDLAMPPFLASRCGDFLAAAADYDSGSRGAIWDFVSHIESHSVQEQESSGVVRIMTVHQSKGLTFDMSIVSGLDGKGGQSTEKLYLGGKDRSQPEWGCLMPSKDIAESDPVMAEARDALNADKDYGKLCASYVAVTRSRRALYIVTDNLGDKTEATHFGRHLELTLSPGSLVYERGEDDWYEDKKIPSSESSQDSAKKEEALTPLVPCTAGTPHPLSPSSLAGKKNLPTEKAAEATHSLDAADLGTEIHEVLSRIEWDAARVDLSSCSKDARSLLELFLESSEAKELFGCPGEGWELWNEKPFDLMIGGKWISGIFDRVHIREVGGKTVEAKIFDYKTNRSTPEKIAEEYEGQMEQYRQAAAKLLGISPDKVEARTVPIRRVTSNH
jgi:ATP-dependent exoDNAse (exonuclease V) beta subunit